MIPPESTEGMEWDERRRRLAWQIERQARYLESEEDRCYGSGTPQLARIEALFCLEKQIRTGSGPLSGRQVETLTKTSFRHPGAGARVDELAQKESSK